MKATTWTIAVRSALLAGAVPALVSAQAPTGNCKINDGSPFQLSGARNYVSMAANSTKPDEVPKHLANAIRVLTDEPEKIKNETGRQYLLLRTYAQFLQREGAQYVMKRGDMGFTTNKEGTHNLLLAIDSAATAVESAMPACHETVAVYRDKYFGEVLNKAIALLDEKPDSASYWAHQALLVSPKDPRPWNVLMSVYQTKGQAATDAAVRKAYDDSSRTAMSTVLSLAGDNKTYQKVAQQSRYNLAVITLQDAENAEGAAKEAAAKQARTLLEQFLKVQPGDPMATQALGRALTLSGDTAAITAVYRDMLEHPEKFTDIQLFEGASGAALAKKDADAAKLFDAALAKNPYHRVGLLNAASVYFQLKDTDRMGPTVKRLIEVDPNNALVWRTYAGYWQLMQKASDADASKKKAAVDSTLAALQREKEVNPLVDVSVASRKGNSFIMQGSVTNRGTSAQSVTIKFELLDEKGAVVGAKDVAVGPVQPGGSSPFSVTVESPKAIAYRYAPLK